MTGLNYVLKECSEEPLPPPAPVRTGKLTPEEMTARDLPKKNAGASKPAKAKADLRQFQKLADFIREGKPTKWLTEHYKQGADIVHAAAANIGLLGELERNDRADEEDTRIKKKAEAEKTAMSDSAIYAKLITEIGKCRERLAELSIAERVWKEFAEKEKATAAPTATTSKEN